MEIDCYESKESDNKLEISRWAQIVARSVEVKEQMEFSKKLKLVQVERNETCTQLYEIRVTRLIVIISGYQRHVMICKRVTTVQRAVEELSEPVKPHTLRKPKQTNEGLTSEAATKQRR